MLSGDIAQDSLTHHLLRCVRHSFQHSTGLGSLLMPCFLQVPTVGKLAAMVRDLSLPLQLDTLATGESVWILCVRACVRVCVRVCV